MKVLQWVGFSQVLSPWLAGCHLLRWPVFPLCAHSPGSSLCVQICSYKGVCPIGSGHTCCLISCLFKRPVPYTEALGVMGFTIWISGEHSSARTCCLICVSVPWRWVVDSPSVWVHFHWNHHWAIGTSDVEHAFAEWMNFCFERLPTLLCSGLPEIFNRLTGSN